ncbi:unnamed protein product, partial [Medioppia subpectinata]
FTVIVGIVLVIVFSKYFQSKVMFSAGATTTVPSNMGSPFLADTHTPSLKGHRALNYSPTQQQTPTTSTPRVGRPLYSVPNT